MLAGARGAVLEIGGGTGANLTHYRDVDRVTIAEPDPFMRSRIGPKLEDARVPVEVSAAGAEALPFPDGSFDTVVSTLVEGLLRGPEPPVWWPVPLAAFLLVQPLRYWSILSLGENWNTRVLVVPGGKLVRRGPYRYFPHPNYVVVAVEVLTFPLIFGAWITAITFSLLNATLLYVRIRTENRALRELSG